MEDSTSIPFDRLFITGWKSSSGFVIIININENGLFNMRYTEEEGGKLNNFAVEPKMYQAEPPTGSEKRNYIILGSVAATLVVGLFVVAAAVS